MFSVLATIVYYLHERIWTKITLDLRARCCSSPKALVNLIFTFISAIPRTILVKEVVYKLLLESNEIFTTALRYFHPRHLRN